MTPKIDPSDIVSDRTSVVDDGHSARDDVAVEGERPTESPAAEVPANPGPMDLQPGVKSLSDNDGQAPVIRVRVSEHTHDALRSVAQARGISVSTLSARVLDEFVSREVLS